MSASRGVHLTVAEPFAGAGGLALGFRAAGFRALWAGEADAAAAKTFRAAFPDVPLVEDILDGTEVLPAVDVLAGGPPCQPFSFAGAQRGQWDPRDGLHVMLAYMRAVRPRAVLIENVKGLLAPSHRPCLQRVQADVRRAGYAAEWRCLNAADYGVPQTRERVFCVAFRDPADADRWRWPAATHSIEALVHQKLAAGAILDDLSRRERATAKRLLRAEPRAGTKARASWDETRRRASLQPWRTIQDALEDLIPKYVPGPNLHAAPRPGRGGGLVDCGRGGRPGAKGTSRAQTYLYGVIRPHEPARTVLAAAEAKGSESCMRITVRNLGTGSSAPGPSIRRLSPAEVARLQTFPDDHPWQGSPRQRYRQIGNAVPVRLAEALAHALVRALSPET